MEIKEFDVTAYQNEPIMIYGATVGAKMIFQCLRKAGIDVECFVDRRMVNEKFCGIPVESPETLTSKKGILLIAVTRSYKSVCQFLDTIAFDNAYSCVNLIEKKTRNDFVYEKDELVGVSDFLVKYPLYVRGFSEEKLILPTLEVFITECCTLRCRDCSHLIKFYKQPKHYNMETIIQYLDNVLRVVDYLEEVVILGGEPLLHPEISKLLYYCGNSEKIGDITVISNGTISPNDAAIAAMEETKTRLRLSDYRELSPKIKEVQQLCEAHNIECFVLHETWTDMGEIFKHNYDLDELKSIFLDCPFAFDLLLLNGKLCRCAHVAHLNNLQKIESSQHDCVDFTDISDGDIKSKKDELWRYMNIDYLEGCQYCNGIKNSIHGIESAIQEKR